MSSESERNLERADALAEMAEGTAGRTTDDQSPEGAPTPAADPIASESEALAALSAAGDGEGAASGTARRTRSSALGGTGPQGAGYHYKKTMVPLLLVAALLLLLVGVGSAAVAAGLDVIPADEDLVARARLLAICAFPIAVILGGGAWIFHRDARRVDPRREDE